jgi:hypothetical protein
MSELTALPGQTIPGTGWRRDELVEAGGEPALMLGLVVLPDGGEPLAKLWPLTGGGWRYVRLGRVEAYRPEPAP